MNRSFVITLASIFIISCGGQTKELKSISDNQNKPIKKENDTINAADSIYKSIHIFVALCDNKHQGIVPVPAAIGNGQKPNSNLYWGCGYGIKTYFKKSDEWDLIKTYKIDSLILERAVFKHKTMSYYLIADAYNGKYIKNCITDFLKSSSAQMKDTVVLDSNIIGINGNSDLLAYIGHNGLMEFQLSESYLSADDKKRDIIILACFSKSYFYPHLINANVNPLVWTTGLMAPEAYTVHDAISGYLKNEPNEKIRIRAAKAYSKYQTCSEKAALNLLVSGWK